MRRLVLLLTAFAVGVTSTVAVAAPEPAAPRCEGPLECADDAAVLELERRIDDHLRYGQLLEIDYRTTDRVLGDVASGGAWGDSALWTGVYLAGQSMRYAVAREKLDEPNGKGRGRGLAAQRLTDEQRAYWSAHREEALSRVR
ncbi:MAG: hypothetical protein EPN99_15310, partial [Frankiales bacterium]